MPISRSVAEPMTAGPAPPTPVEPAYLVFDTESVPDGRLLALVRYPRENLSPAEAIERARADARQQSASGSDFLPVTFQYPVATCVLRVGADFVPQAITCLGAPHYRPRTIVEQFWAGVNHYRGRRGPPVKLVTFNGIGFDLPLMEMAAFRYGVSGKAHFELSRRRPDSGHLDLMDWMTNSGAIRLAGGLDVLSKLLGIPGKMEVRGEQVYAMYLEGKLQEINDHCMHDTLDTYFVLLRTRVLTGELSLEDEHRAALRARDWLQRQVPTLPALGTYLERWGEWDPWP